MSALVLDIETIPLAASLAVSYPVEERNPPANYKSADVIAEWRAKDETAWREGLTKKCSTNPRLGRVLCVGVVAANNDGVPLVFMAPHESDERDALGNFWLSVEEYNGAVVTWNGSWDLRFLLMRSLALGIRPTVSTATIRAWFRKYVYTPHFDCKAALMNWDVMASGEGLDEWSRFLGVAGKTGGTTGADVWPMFQRGELAEIGAYCADDVRATRDIYARIAPLFGDAEPLKENWRASR